MRLLLSCSSMLLLVCTLCSGQQPEPWQTDWDAFIDEYNKACTRDPKCEPQRFAGKTVTWRGKISAIEERGAQNDTAWRIIVKVNVTPRVLTGPDGQPLPGALPEKVGNPLLIQPESEAVSAKWREASAGDEVVFKAVFGSRGPIQPSRVADRTFADVSLERPELIETIKAK
jgi:hypothetical protein